MVIYKATNLINNKSYIGQTIHSLESRKNEHINHAKLNRYSMIFHKAIRKYGEENFKWEVLCECKDIDELNKMEIHYIKEHNTFIDSGVGYNMTTGGDNFTRSKEACKNISKGRKGMKFSEKHKENLRKNHPRAMLGKRHTKISRKKMSKALAGKKLTEQHKENLKIAASKRDNTNIGKGNLGKTPTIETRKKLSDAFKGRKLSEETKEKIRKTCKLKLQQPKVECPHCKLVGGSSLMKRYHFDNCKNKA